MAWHCQVYDGYGRTSTEAIDNAKEIYNNLHALGWSLNAICAILGNIGYEGGYNPWRWQNDNIQPYQTTNYGDAHAYGLFQFDNATKYQQNSYAKSLPEYGPNWSDRAGKTTDGIAQLKYVNQYADYYSTNAYPLSYSQFKVSTQTPSYLAKAWLYNYERPADPASTENGRASEAEYWYTVLQNYTPVPPVPTGDSGALPFMMYLRRRF